MTRIPSRGRPRRARRCAGLLAAAALSISCGARLIELPAGPGSAATDGREAVADATRDCRSITTATAEVGVSGSVGGQRLRARLLVGFEPPSSLRLEAVAPFGQPIFIFVARGGQATLLLTREQRVLRNDRPADVLEALTGVPLDAADLRTLLVGCAASPQVEQARELGGDWRVVPEGQRQVYLRRDSQSGRWQIVAVVYRQPDRPEWRVEYRDFNDGVPRALRLVSSDRDRFNLGLSVSAFDTGTTLEPEAFEVVVPVAASPMTLEELREAGPLAGSFDEE
jgi:hypothetical protein